MFSVAIQMVIPKIIDKDSWKCFRTTAFR